MNIKLKAEKINYSEIINKFLQSKFAEKYSSTFLAALKKMIGGGINILPQKIKDAMVTMILDQHQGNIISQLNGLLSDKEIEARLINLTFFGGAKMMNIKAEIDSINYEQIIIKFLPQIIGLIPENENTKVFTDALKVVNDDLEGIVKIVLQTIDDEKKEELLKLFAEKYKQNICELLNKLLSDNGISAKISDLSIL